MYFNKIIQHINKEEISLKFSTFSLLKTHVSVVFSFQCAQNKNQIQIRLESLTTLAGRGVIIY